MAHFLPAPGLSVALLLTWLLLTDSLSPGQWLLGSVIALAVPPLIGAKSKMVHARQRLGTILRLGVVVAIDIDAVQAEVIDGEAAHFNIVAV